MSNLAVYVTSTAEPTKGAVTVYLYVPEVSVENSNYTIKPAPKPVVVAVPSNLYIAVNDTVIEYNIPTKTTTKTFTTPSGNNVSYLLNTSNGLYVGDAAAPSENAYVYLIDSSFSLVATYTISGGGTVYSMSTYGSNILIATEPSTLLMVSGDLSSLLYSTTFEAAPVAVVGNESAGRIYLVTYGFGTIDNIFVLNPDLTTFRSTVTPDGNHGYTLYAPFDLAGLGGTMYVGTYPVGDSQCHLYAYDSDNNVITASYTLPYGYYQEAEFYAANQATGGFQTSNLTTYIVDYYYNISGTQWLGGGSLYILNSSTLSQSTSIGFPFSYPVGFCYGGGAAIQTSPDFPDYLILSGQNNYFSHSGVYMVNLITKEVETVYLNNSSNIQSIFALIAS